MDIGKLAEITKRYLLLYRGTNPVGEFLKQEFGEDVEKILMNISNFEKHPVGSMLEQAKKYVTNCTFLELPRYVNHPSPSVREIVERRLKGG